MNEAVRQTLRELIAKYGLGLCDDPRRCEGLLRDLCPNHRREVNVLIIALEEGIPAAMVKSNPGVPVEIALPKLVQQLVSSVGLSAEVSRWAVDTWALAPGWITEAQLNEANHHETEIDPSARRVSRIDNGSTITAVRDKEPVQKTDANEALLAVTQELRSEVAQLRRDVYELESKRGRIDYAVREHREALKINPDDARAHCKLGIAYSYEGRLNDAIAEFGEALRVVGWDIADIASKIWKDYADQGKLEVGIGVYEHALKINRKDADAHFMLGMGYWYQGRHNAAIREYEEVLSLKPGDRDARIALTNLKGYR